MQKIVLASALRVRFDNGSPDAVTQENWRDTVCLSPGARYRLDDRWTLRGGIGYETSRRVLHAARSCRGFGECSWTGGSAR